MNNKITDSVYYVGVLNPNLRVFDIVMNTEYGTTYNSYIVKGEKTALVECCHITYFDWYLNNIKEVCDPAEIDYIILNHTEPDHSSALARLLEFCPKAQIVCSAAASIYLKNITNKPDLHTIISKDGDTLDLGNNKILKFINAPFLHWPDTQFTYFSSEKVLFSCDFLGSHYCEPQIIDTHISYKDTFKSAVSIYYNAIMAPFKPYVVKGLEKIKDLAIDIACVSHGPILTVDGLLPYVLEQYKIWSSPVVKDKKTVAIFYTSAYGNTGIAAKAIADEISKTKPDLIIETYDIINHDMSLLARVINECDGFLIGTPTINKDAVPPVWALIANIDAINCAKKPCGAFGSFGWSGEAVPALLSRLTTLKCNFIGQGVRFNFVPSEVDLEKVREYAREFASNF